MEKEDAFEGVRRIAAAETLPLRHAVLRPTQTLADCVYPLDDAPETLHVGFFAAGALIGIGSIFREPPPDSDDPGAWRIRGMAVPEAARGRGVGGAVLSALVAHAARGQEGGLAWCNGRVRVRRFYQRHGFRQVGVEFDLPPIGAHVVLKRPLSPVDRALAPPLV